MNNINDILSFNHKISTFYESGNNIIPIHVVNLCNVHISKLKAITDRIGISLISDKPVKGIRDVYLKFISAINNDDNLVNLFDKRELRTLSFSLTYKEAQLESIFNTPERLARCISVLNDNWRDSYITGLFDCYLSCWKSTNSESFSLLSTFVVDKIKKYQGSRSIILSIKDNIKYFNKDKGDLELGSFLALTNKSISEATKVISLPDSWFTYPYFSGVIDCYFEKSKGRLEDTIDDITLALEKHSNSIKATRTNMVIVSKMICHTTNSSEALQDKVKDIAFRLVGDPGIASTWRPPNGASVSETSIIIKARDILNEWVTRHFINVFFEKCINDRRRKGFWLQYSKNITAFKIFGSYQTKRMLKSDKRIKEYVDARFITHGGYGNVSALLFRMRDHVLIEFSDPGYAFYAYHTSNTNAPSLDAININSVEKFRDTSLPMLVYRSGYEIHSTSKEGRLSHADATLQWEEVFSFWLKKVAGVNV
jgi:hypothetical protein